MRRIHEVSGGHPLFALELARAVAADGDALRAPRVLRLPDSLQGTILRRLESVPDELMPLLETVARRGDIAVPDGALRSLIVRCKSGEVAVGGGAGITGAVASDAIIYSDDPREADSSLPEDGEPATAWRAVGENQTGALQVMSVHVLCASP
jgi:hypothetical protein